MSFLRSRSGLWAIGIIAACSLAAGLWLWHRPPAPGPPGSPAQPKEAVHLPSAPDQPDVEITADHQLQRVRHKDAKGLSPLETVVTPEGTMTIQRTFDSAGHLLKEEKFLHGEPVSKP